MSGHAIARPDQGEVILSVSDLTVQFLTAGLPVQPVREVSLDLKRGERLGLVGESGSGKSLTALALMRLLPAGAVVGGSAILEGTDLFKVSESEMSRLRGNRIAMIYQDPMSALNPVFTIGSQIAEAVRLATGVGKKAAVHRAAELLAEVGVPNPRERLRSYPHEFSGGMRQRVVIAMALAGDPAVIVADEPTTALDVTTQARVMELMDTLVDRHGLSIVLITHDLGVAASFCDEINVMYAGRIVERAPTRDLFARPVHPYAEGLMSSICTVDADVTVPIRAIPGQPPLPGQLPTGCSYHPRCPVAMPECATTVPQPVQRGRREAECLLADPRLETAQVEDARNG